jgi:hypothetical protein
VKQPRNTSQEADQLMQCAKHPFDRASDVCTHCGQLYCRPCLVYPAGEAKEAFCVPCTVARSGIRTRSATKPVKPRVVRHRRKELKSALRSLSDLNFMELEGMSLASDLASELDAEYGRADRH